jgi:predicted amidophosphoribosyltransferase
LPRESSKLRFPGSLFSDSKLPRPNIRRILIIDDVIATGSTAAVITEKLVATGMPADVDIHIAAPVLIPAWAMTRKGPLIGPPCLPTSD